MNKIFSRNLSTNDSDVSYEDYVATTFDPGKMLFNVAVIICAGSILFLPLISKKLDEFLKYRTRRRKEKETTIVATNTISEGYKAEDDDDFVDIAAGGCSHLSCVQSCGGMGYSAAIFVFDTDIVRWRKRGSHARSNIDWRREMVSRGIRREARESMSFDEDENYNVEAAGVWSSVEIVLQKPDEGESEQGKTDDENPIDEAIEQCAFGLDCQKDQKPGSELPPPKQKILPKVELKLKNAITKFHQNDPRIDIPQTPSDPFDFLHRALLFMYTIIKYDNETKRILRLAIPFTCSAIASTMADLVVVGIVAHQLGTDAMVAFAMTEVLVGITSSFAGGLVEAISSLGSMAFGARNYKRCGEYLINSCICYMLCEIVFACVWSIAISPAILMMGFGEEVAELAQGYVYVKVAVNLLEGVEEAILDFLEVVEYEAYANIMYCTNSIVEVVLVGVAATLFDANLVMIGLTCLINQVFFLIVNIVVPKMMGWLAIFESGLYKRPFTNDRLLKELVKTALPLAFGNLLAYAEWEILIVFALILGPAEAVVWSLLGFIWDVFESTTEAIGDASEVRCAYQMGKGRPALAKLSAYKSMFIASTLSLSVTIVFICLRNNIATWLTQDTTLQAMLTELLPLIALGNISMNLGMTCWALLGAQGRYRLATSIAIACSLLITVPIAAVLTIAFRFNLQGLTFAVVIGYTVTAMLLTVFLLRSDWDKLSNKIQAKMKAEEESESEESDIESNASEDAHAFVPLSSQKSMKRDDSTIWELVQHGDLYEC
ncbi:hypothetical protein ACHAXR_010152 [Thalassiosira sp. AJA248-18]